LFCGHGQPQDPGPEPPTRCDFAIRPSESKHERQAKRKTENRELTKAKEAQETGDISSRGGRKKKKLRSAVVFFKVPTCLIVLVFCCALGAFRRKMKRSSETTKGF
jgi:hypothetical protein